MSSIETQFKKAVHFVRNKPPNPDATAETKLKYYALFKQANEGDVTGSQPWAVQLEARAKWDAWNGVKGMSKEEAMRKYVELVANANPDWDQSEIVKNFSG